jgi:hypothetical protein
MKDEAEEEHKISVTRPKEKIALKKAKGIDVKNISAARVAIYDKYKNSNKKTDWVLARQELQDAFDKARKGGAVFASGEVDQQYEELERSLAHLKPIEWTGDIKELKQLTALATPVGKTPKDAAIDRGMAVESVKMAIRRDPITSQLPFFQNNLNTYAEGIVDNLIALQTGGVVKTNFYDLDGNAVTLDNISEWPYTLGKSKDTALQVDRKLTKEEEQILRNNNIRYYMVGSEGYEL